MDTPERSSKSGLLFTLLAICAVVCGIILLGAFKQGGQQATHDPSKLNVVSTIGMIHDVVQNIGGTHVQSVGLMGPGIDPHLYRASEGDVAKLAKADVIFYNGLHLESKMGEIIEKMGRKKHTVAVTSHIKRDKLLSPDGFDGMPDPHVWFDVQLWIDATETIRDALVAADPKNKRAYTDNATAYIKELNALDAYVKQLSRDIPIATRVLVTAHDAFNYFGQAYGFKVKGLQGISTESEAGTKDVQDLADFISRHRIPAIFVESSVPERNIKAVQRAVKSRGWTVAIGGELFSDAMGNSGTPEGTYIGMVKHNIESIVSALKGESITHSNGGKK